MQIVDAHLHLWDPTVLRYDWLQGSLRRRLGPAELHAALGREASADLGFVFVQADCRPEQSLAEVDWASSLASDVGIRGIVARIPLEDVAAAEGLLGHYADRPQVVGVRRMLQAAAGLAATTQARESLTRVADAGLAFDACVGWQQLPEVAALADATPELTVVLDHLGKPELPAAGATLDEVRRSPWASSIRELARRSNVVCKLSGVPAEARGEWDDVRAVHLLDVALEAFGAERLLFGSDWPVSEPYDRWLGTVRSWLADRGDDAQVAAVLAGNAAHAYRLDDGGQRRAGRVRSDAMPPSTSMQVPVVEPAPGPTR